MQPTNRPRGGAHSKKKHAVATATPQKRSLKENKQQPSKAAHADAPTGLGVDVIYMTVLLAVAMLLSAGVLQNQIVSIMPSAGQSGVRAGVLFVVYLVELVGLSYCAYRHREKFVDFFRLRISKQEASKQGAQEKKNDSQGATTLSNGWVSAAYVIAFLVGLRVLSMLWSLFTQEIGWRIAGASDVVDLFGTTNFGLILTIVLVVILAPLVEELVFRGLIQKWLSTRLGMWTSIALTSLLFAMYHLSFWAAPLNIALGVCTGYLAQKRSTLYPALALHITYNATLVLAAYYLSF